MRPRRACAGSAKAWHGVRVYCPDKTRPRDPNVCSDLSPAHRALQRVRRPQVSSTQQSRGWQLQWAGRQEGARGWVRTMLLLPAPPPLLAPSCPSLVSVLAPPPSCGVLSLCSDLLCPQPILEISNCCQRKTAWAECVRRGRGDGGWFRPASGGNLFRLVPLNLFCVWFGLWKLGGVPCFVEVLEVQTERRRREGGAAAAESDAQEPTSLKGSRWGKQPSTSCSCCAAVPMSISRRPRR